MLEIPKLFYYHNHARNMLGLKSLKNSTKLNRQCRDYARLMASKGQLYHSANLDQEIRLIFPACVYWGENIGVAQSPHAAKKLHSAFMASLDHRKNVLDPRFTVCGIGMHKTKAGVVWTCVRFAKN